MTAVKILHVFIALVAISAQGASSDVCADASCQEKHSTDDHSLLQGSTMTQKKLQNQDAEEDGSLQTENAPQEKESVKPARLSADEQREKREQNKARAERVAKLNEVKSKILETLQDVRARVESKEPDSSTDSDPIHEIQDLVNNVILPDLDRQKTDVQSSVGTEHANMIACNDDSTARIISQVICPTGGLQIKRDDDRITHNTCRNNEKNEKSAMERKCGLRDDYVNALGRETAHSDAQDPADNPPVVPADKSLDNVAHYLDEMEAWDPREQKREFTSLRNDCDSITETYHNREARCNQNQRDYELRCCEARIELLDQINQLDDCFEREERAFYSASDDAAVHVESLKAAYEGAKMIQCYLDVWLSDHDTSSTDANVHAKCQNTTIDTSVMDITYPQPPEKLDIEAISEYCSGRTRKVEMWALTFYPGVETESQSWERQNYGQLEDTQPVLHCSNVSRECANEYVIVQGDSSNGRCKTVETTFWGSWNQCGSICDVAPYDGPSLVRPSFIAAGSPDYEGEYNRYQPAFYGDNAMEAAQAYCSGDEEGAFKLVLEGNKGVCPCGQCSASDTQTEATPCPDRWDGMCHPCVTDTASGCAKCDPGFNVDCRGVWLAKADNHWRIAPPCVAGGGPRSSPGECRPEIKPDPHVRYPKMMDVRRGDYGCRMVIR